MNLKELKELIKNLVQEIKEGKSVAALANKKRKLKSNPKQQPQDIEMKEGPQFGENQNTSVRRRGKFIRGKKNKFSKVNSKLKRLK